MKPWACSPGCVRGIVRTAADIWETIHTLDSMSRSDDADREYHQERIAQGICFVWAEYKGRDIFAPSRWAGYRHNHRRKHARRDVICGMHTNRAISKVLGAGPVKNRKLETRFHRYCAEYGISPENRVRRYWPRTV
jgi:hypothetical protein